MKNFLALDLGGSAIKHGLYNEKGESKSEAGETPINVSSVEGILGQIDEIKSKYSQVDGIGISMPGLVDKKTGLITHGGAIQILDKVDLRGILQDKYKVDVTIENDANCAALAEYWLGNGKGYETIVCMTIGTGIGGGLIINGKLHHGSHSFSGEFGTMVMDLEPKPEMKYFGYASTGSLIKRAGETDENIKNGRDFFANLENPSIKALYDEWIKVLATGIYNIAVALDPCKILIGGGISSQHIIYEDIKRVIDDIMYYPYQWTVEPCHFRNEAGKIGAIYKLVH